VHLPQRWLPVQVLVVALCFFLNMLDGMDVVILSYVAPSLSAAWHIPPDKLGIVFSAGFAGMATGGLVLAPLADIFGRRPLVVVSLIIMALGMVLSGLGGNVTQLILSRLIVGVGIGSVVVAMAALTAEYAPPHHRHFAITLLQAGYPIGATLTGFVVAHVIGGYGWQKILIGAGVVTAAMVPLAVFLLPESLSFLLVRQSAGMLSRANKLLVRLRRPVLMAWPPKIGGAEAKAGPQSLFGAGLTRITLLLWLVFIICSAPLYFIVTWIPKLAVAAGLSVSHAIYAGAVYSIGGALGTALLGWIASWLDLRRLILIFFALATIVMVLFGVKGFPLPMMLFLAFLIGFFVMGGFGGLYPLAAAIYPSPIRATGIGWAAGMSRLGAVVGPALGGYLLADKLLLWQIFLIFAIPLAAGGACVQLIGIPMSVAKPSSAISAET